jgi:hypothetical protein
VQATAPMDFLPTQIQISVSTHAFMSACRIETFVVEMTTALERCYLPAYSQIGRCATRIPCLLESFFFLEERPFNCWTGPTALVRSWGLRQECVTPHTLEQKAYAS